MTIPATSLKRFTDAKYVSASDYGVYPERDETDGLNALAERLQGYQTLLLEEDAPYYVRPGHFILPTKDATFGAPAIASIGAGNWMMEAIAGGDSTAGVIVQDRWLTGAANGNFASTPWEIRDHFIECAGLCKFGIVLKSYAPKVRFGVVQGATDSDILLTRQNQDGSLGTAFFNSGAVIEGNELRNFGHYGFRCEGASGSPSQAPTDGKFLHNSCWGGEVGAHFDTCTGWEIAWQDIFTCTVASAEFNGLGRHHGIAFNKFDSAPVKIGNIESGCIGDLVHNKFSAPVQFNGTADSSVERLILESNAFNLLEGSGADAYVEHNNNNANKLLVSRFNRFKTTNPHRFGAGVTLGIIRVEGGIDGNGMLSHDGLVLPEYGSTTPLVPPSGLRLFASRG